MQPIPPFTNPRQTHTCSVCPGENWPQCFSAGLESCWLRPQFAFSAFQCNPACLLSPECLCALCARMSVRRECLVCAFVRVYVRACALGMSRAPMGDCEAERCTEHLRSRSVAKHNATFLEPQRYPTVAQRQGRGHDRRLHGLYGLQDHAPFAPY